MAETRCIYIAGPMRGYPDLNFYAFRQAARVFRDAGWTVKSPVEIGQAAFGSDPDAVPPSAFLREDIRALIDCDAIALLPGWRDSTGARAEAAVALVLGLTFYSVAMMGEIEPPTILAICGYDRAPAAPTTEDGR